MQTIKTPKGNEAKLEYTYDGMALGRSAYTVKNVVKISPPLEGDAGFLAHELTHVDQWFEYKFFCFRYKQFGGFRLQMELEAYAAQLKADGSLAKLKDYAMMLSQNYNVSIKWEDAARKLAEMIGGHDDKMV